MHLTTNELEHRINTLHAEYESVLLVKAKLAGLHNYLHNRLLHFQIPLIFGIWKKKHLMSPIKWSSVVENKDVDIKEFI